MLNLDSIIQTARATGFFTIILPLEQELLVLPVTPGEGVLVADNKMNLQDCMDMITGQDAGKAAPALIQLSIQLTNLGLKLKNHGGLPDACLCYRVALFIAVYYKIPDGMNALSGNNRLLLEQIIDLTKRGNIIRFNITEEEVCAKARGEYMQAIQGDRQAAAQLKDKLKNTRERMAADATAMLHFLGMENGLPSRGNYQEAMLPAIRDLSVAAGNSILRKAIARTRLGSFGPDDTAAALLLILEELSQTAPDDYMNEYTDAAAEEKYFSYIWSKYDFLRSHIVDFINNTNICPLYESTYRQFEYISLILTTGGGAFGHIINYNFSGFLQIIGRDYLASLLVHESGDTVKQYVLTERIRCRAMLNWMGRCVSHTRLPRQFTFPLITERLSGSINAVEPLSVKEMAEIPAMAGAHILSYFLCPVGLIAWLQTTAGEIMYFKLDWTKIRSQLNAYFQKGGDNETFGTPDTYFFESVMPGLAGELFPAALLEKLERLEIKKLIILADQELDYLPFCALVMPSKEYLVQQYELSYAPSLTAFYISEAETGNGITSGNLISTGDMILQGQDAGSSKAWKAPLLMGVADFSAVAATLQLNLPDLSGVENELRVLAALLDTPCFLNGQVNRQLIDDVGFRARIMHLASHALFNMENPADSFVILYDGIIKAMDIYLLDRGYRSGLVVLSACQTGLGEVVTDASYSLANAFIVAGSKSVISSLWLIPDEATVALMRIFYKGLISGLGINTALRNAQLALIQDQAYAAPQNWAAFKLTGLLRNPFTYSER